MTAPGGQRRDPALLRPRRGEKAHPHVLPAPSSFPYHSDLPIAEAAKLQLPDGTPARLRSVLHQKLSAIFTTQRLVVSLFSLFGPLLHSFYGEWDFIFALGTLPSPDLRVVVYLVSLFVPMLVIAAAFPDDASSASGAKLAYVPAVLGSTLRCFGVCLDAYHNSAIYGVNGACLRVYYATAVVVFGLWLLGLVHGVRGRFSWALARFVHGFEGGALTLCALALRLLGPPLAYSPGAMGFPAALTRGCLPMLLALVILAPPIRLRIADWARRYGCFHVAIDLGDLSVAHSSGGSSASLASNSDDANEPLTETADSIADGSTGGSHYTTKLVGVGPDAFVPYIGLEDECED